jgi:hypothetical protein
MWGARDCSGNPFGAAKRLQRKARFFAALPQKMRYYAGKKVNADAL